MSSVVNMIKYKHDFRSVNNLNIYDLEFVGGYVICRDKKEKFLF